MMLKFVMLLAMLVKANGHGQLIRPVPRGDSLGRAESWMQRAPVYTLNGNTGGYSANSMRCHDFNTPSALTTITAGQNLPLDVRLEAAHPGDCYLYISYSCEGKPLDQPCEPTDFFKIASFPGCGATAISPPNQFTLQAPIPAQLPACEHCVLRWEWTAHQQVTNIEFYVQCADVKIVSNAPPTRPNPLVAISGIQHLPSQANQYRAVYNGQSPSRQYLVGPAEATFTACTAGSPGCVGAGNTGGGGTPGPQPTPPPVNPPGGGGNAPTPSPPVLNCPNKVWNQCGGKSFSGASCCPQGTFCNRQNEWYSQCIPGTGNLATGDGALDAGSNKAGLSTPASVGVGVGVVGAIVGAVLGFTMYKKKQQQNAMRAAPATAVAQHNPMYV